jgi:hypothetical protein|tara:strand:- start:1640 stop:2044 length:405 start_codon:yes stop_codon:yes gene_type:complete
MNNKDKILKLVENFDKDPYSISDNDVELIKDYYYNHVINILFIPRNYLVIGSDKNPNRIYFKSVLQNDYLVIFNYPHEEFIIANIKYKKNNINKNVESNNSINSVELSNNISICDSSSALIKKKNIYCPNCIII